MIQKTLLLSIILTDILIESTSALSFTCPKTLPAMGSPSPFLKTILETKENGEIKITCEYVVPGAFMSIWLPKGTLCKFSNHPQLTHKEESLTCHSDNVEDCTIEYSLPQMETFP